MNSMTGFGRGIADSPIGKLVVEMKTVNSRFLDIRTRFPENLHYLEVPLRQQIAKALGRGYCNVDVKLMATDDAPLPLNEDRLSQYISQMKVVANKNAVPLESLMPLVAGQADLFVSREDEEQGVLVEVVQRAGAQALDALLDMRRAEGAVMADDMRQKVEHMDSLVQDIVGHAAEMNRGLLQKYRDKIDELLNDSVHIASPERIDTEVAILAEKADINEEITRLKSHFDQVRNLIDGKGEVGRKLEFMVQEMIREINTIASKSPSSTVRHAVVDVKADLEKIKEMILNVE